MTRWIVLASSDNAPGQEDAAGYERLLKGLLVTGGKSALSELNASYVSLALTGNTDLASTLLRCVGKENDKIKSYYMYMYILH